MDTSRFNRGFQASDLSLSKGGGLLLTGRLIRRKVANPALAKLNKHGRLNRSFGKNGYWTRFPGRLRVPSATIRGGRGKLTVVEFREGSDERTVVVSRLSFRG